MNSATFFRFPVYYLQYQDEDGEQSRAGVSIPGTPKKMRRAKIPFLSPDMTPVADERTGNEEVMDRAAVGYVQPDASHGVISGSVETG